MNWCSAAVSVGEQLPEDDLVRPKHVTIECERFWVALETEMSK
jgi:hypothetical protein